MLIVMQSDCSQDRVEQVRQLIEGLGCHVRPFQDRRRPILIVDEGTAPPDHSFLESLEGVAWIGPGTKPLRHVPRVTTPGGTRIPIGPITVGGEELTIIAGPCAVEDEETPLTVARRMKESGVALLRWGAYKPRSSPYDFQGLGEPALKMLARARDATGLPVITEAVDEASLERVEEYADVIRIGARNMHNYALLKRAGRSPRPVFLKRGFAAGLENLLQAAGADGLMAEVHPDPASALSDGAQALDPSQIADLVDDLTSPARHVRRRGEVLI